MAKLISLTVYEADGVRLKTAQTILFSTGKFIIYPYTGTDDSLLSTIQMTTDYTKTFSITEPLEDILLLAN